jgi:hypothetical protein
MVVSRSVREFPHAAAASARLIVSEMGVCGFMGVGGEDRIRMIAGEKTFDYQYIGSSGCAAVKRGCKFCSFC